MTSQLQEKSDDREQKTNHGGQHSAEEHECAEQSGRTAGSESLGGAAENAQDAGEQGPEADFEGLAHSSDYTAIGNRGVADGGTGPADLGAGAL